MKRVMETADAAVGALMDAYRAAGIFDKTLWVATSDHGMWTETPRLPCSHEPGSAKT
jgi:arylsulfatase A-like enzyme